VRNVKLTIKIHKKVNQTIGLVLMLFFSSISGHTQTYNHTSVWSRFLFSKQFGKFILSGDGAYRRQNNFYFSKHNFLQNPFLDAQRLTVAYRNNKWLFSFAVSRWHAYQILGKEADFERLPTLEWRFTPGIEYFQKINKGMLQWRTQYEYRNFVDRTAGRFRQRLQFRQPISKTNSLVFLEEFLIGSPPNSTKKYEQNQLGVTFNHNFTDKLESEIGYRYIFRRRRISGEIDNENALIIGLMLRL